ncbi:hypothetical protein D9758_019124 [Tetrapyrgos nigripes]|uniref:Glycine-rich protein n=1 Tax=Tetrapyrgos nigripes TaxID=182062 RepID=A0A8H5ETD0_9AGAR|nr:hypothetical protein D9758_019124 [Tetrapyrgos nigripes]
MYFFFCNTAAVAGTFTAVGLVSLVALILIITTTIRKRRAKAWDREIAEAAREAWATGTVEVPREYLDENDGGRYGGAGYAGGGYETGYGGGGGGGGGAGPGGVGGEAGSHGTYGVYEQSPMGGRGERCIRCGIWVEVECRYVVLVVATGGIV